MLRKKRKYLSKNSLQLRKIPVKSFSIPKDCTCKKKKVSEDVETGHFKKKDESDEWSTCSTSIEKMRDTALDSEWCPDFLAHHSSETKIEWDISEHIQQIKPVATSTPIYRDESIPLYVASSPKDVSRSRTELKNIPSRKMSSLNISPIKGKGQYGHYFPTQESLEQFHPVHLPSSSEILKADELLIRNSDEELQILHEFQDSIPPVFTDDELPSIRELLRTKQDDWVVTSLDPVTSDPEFQNFYPTHSKESNNHGKMNRTYGVQKHSKTDSKLYSSRTENSKLEIGQKPSAIEIQQRFIENQRNVIAAETSDPESFSSEKPYIPTSTARNKSNNTFTKNSEKTDIHELHGKSDALKIKQKKSSKRTKNGAKSTKRKSFFRKSSEDAGNTSLLNRAKLIRRHQDALKKVQICCLTTLKCSLPLQ